MLRSSSHDHKMNACLLAGKTMTQHLCEIVKWNWEGHITVTEDRDIHPFMVPSILLGVQIGDP
jgi:hypothetical protein